MAEETLVKEQLTAQMIRAGAGLIERLDSRNWLVSASVWLYQPEKNAWRLFIASPAAANPGPKSAYQSIQAALSELSDGSLSLKDITVLPPRDPFIQLFRFVINTGPKIVGIRFSRSTINGHFIEDSYIYRVNL